MPLPSFNPAPQLDFETNFHPGSSGNICISTLKMSQVVEILISNLVLIVN